MNMRLEQLPGVRDHLASTVRQMLGGPGQPLRPDVRADMEPRFGADLSRVLVHADETAHASARQLKANAYTVSQHIVFGTGRFAPQTAERRALLAHELIHAVQQRQANGIPHKTTNTGGAVKDTVRHDSARALAGAAPTVAPGPMAIARDEGTAEVVDVVLRLDFEGYHAFQAGFIAGFNW
jgi:hypothetical protein